MRRAIRLDDQSPVLSCSMGQLIGMTDYQLRAADPEIQELGLRVRDTATSQPKLLEA